MTLCITAAIMTVGGLTACIPTEQLSAGEIVARMEKAEAQVEDYHALLETALIDPGSGVRTLVQEVWSKDPNLLRVETREGPSEMVDRVTVYNGEQVWFYDPKANVVQMFELSAPLELADREMEAAMLATAKELVGEGSAEYLGEETVAGRRAHKVQFMPRSGSDLSAAVGGEAITVWIDREHGRRLRMEVPLPDGGHYSMEYRLLEHNVGLPDRLFQLSHPAGTKAVAQPPPATLPDSKPMELREAQQAAKFPLLLPAYLPRGMVLSQVRVVGEGESVTLAYGDGERTLTLSQALTVPEVRLSDLGEGIALRGTTALLQRQGERSLSLRWQESGLLVFLSGTLSEKEALKIAESMQ
jgi:outer membrane lipoprotein-sorting protein